MIDPPETFETSRLRLRRLRRDDAPAIFDGYAQDPGVTRYLSWVPHRTIADTHAFIEHVDSAWASGTETVWAITSAGDDRLIGTMGFRCHDHALELGYVLGRKHWNHGVTTEAAAALVRWALTLDRVYRVYAFCDVENVASARVLEKVGMTREGVLRRWARLNVSTEPRDCAMYARVR